MGVGEQQPGLAGGVVVEPGDAGVAVVDEGGDPPSARLVGRQGAEHTVGQLLQSRADLGEVGADHLDVRAVGDEAGGEDLHAVQRSPLPGGRPD